MIVQIIFFFALFLAPSLIGCATAVKVPVQIMHPAEVNMSPYKQVVIGEMTGDMSQRFLGGLKETLVEAKQFKVVDRSQLRQILGELTLSHSDLADSSKRLRIGKLLSSAVIFTGHVEGKYNEELTSENTRCKRAKGKDSEGKTIYEEYDCKYYKRLGQGTVTGSMDVVSVETGEIIKSKKISGVCANKTTAKDATPEPLDKEAILSCALKEGLNIFTKAIIPWSETIYLAFAKDGALPALEQGIRYVQINDYPNAAKVFKDTAKSAEMNPEIKAGTIAKAYWNLGLAYQCQNQHDQALEAMKKAYVFKPDPVYLKGQENIKKMQADLKELKNQGVVK
ncbi:MAG: tetratricopeptide repeat protein [Elusimicrobia bacterium]|nr:tetratricopeptide repeat protein [Elusimicrobiota bacterium]